MEIIFPFKNMATNYLLEFVEEIESIRDYTLTQKNKYPYPENYFLKKVDYCKNRFPSFENEILQIIQTTNQATIDIYFAELGANVNHVRKQFSLDNLRQIVSIWNKNLLKGFEERVEQKTVECFNDENRKRKHLEEYEVLENTGIFSKILGKEPKVVKKINYNFYCINEQPEYYDEEEIESYHGFLLDLSRGYYEIAEKYLTIFNKGEITSVIEKQQYAKPVVFVEGEHDITYIKHAAMLLGNTDLLEKIELRQRGGASNLDKIWDVYKEDNWETVPQKKLLLYDCDINKIDEARGNLIRKVIDSITENMISKGIENLFPNSLIKRAMKGNEKFIDITKVKRTKRGIKSEETHFIVNADEKKNLCQWICDNGTKEDFRNFNIVFNLINLVVE
jgi:hypothetical protein